MEARRIPSRGALGAPGTARERSAALRVVFMGTPDFAVPALRLLLAEKTVVGVFSRPDRPAGRGRAVHSSPVADIARSAGVPLFQPRSLWRGPDAVDATRALIDLEPDVVVVAAYGLILPTSMLITAPHGALNIHASLLPRWRGAAPIQHAILAGDERTGVTIMVMNEGLDTGPIIASEAIEIGARETAGELSVRLAELGADLLVRTLGPWVSLAIGATPQPKAGITHAPSLSKADGEIDWQAPAEAIARRVRGLHPWPGAYTFLPDGTRLKLHAARAEPAPAEEMPGVVLDHGGLPAVGTTDGVLVLERVQAAGGRAMAADDFFRGRPELNGWRLGLPALGALEGSPSGEDGGAARPDGDETRDVEPTDPA